MHLQQPCRGQASETCTGNTRADNHKKMAKEGGNQTLRKTSSIQVLKVLLIGTINEDMERSASDRYARKSAYTRSNISQC